MSSFKRMLLSETLLNNVASLSADLQTYHKHFKYNGHVPNTVILNAIHTNFTMTAKNLYKFTMKQNIPHLELVSKWPVKSTLIGWALALMPLCLGIRVWKMKEDIVRSSKAYFCFGKFTWMFPCHFLQNTSRTIFLNLCTLLANENRILSDISCFLLNLLDIEVKVQL